MKNTDNIRLDEILQANNDFIRSFTVSEINLISMYENLTDNNLFEIIQSIHNFDNFNEYNDPFGIHNSGSFRYGEWDVVFGIRYFNEETQMMMYPYLEDPTKIISMTISEYKEKLYSKQHFDNQPMLIMLTKEISEDIDFCKRKEEIERKFTW